MENWPMLRSFFKRFNRFMLLLWQLGLGPWVNFWPDVTGRIMVIVHVTVHPPAADTRSAPSALQVGRLAVGLVDNTSSCWYHVQHERD